MTKILKWSINISGITLILNTPDDFFTDHIDRDRLNNIRANLRCGKNSDNIRNQVKNKLRGVTSKYKGVSIDNSRGLYAAAITVDFKKKHLGRFHDEDKAAQAYNAAAVKYFGEFANLNVLAK